MASRRTPAEIEDIILRKILMISLTPSPDPKITYLELTAAELISEDKLLLLSGDLLDRILIDRLNTDPAPEPPFTYLVNCYRRAVDEAKKVTSMKDVKTRSQIELSIRQSKSLFVTYARLQLGNHVWGGVGAVDTSDLLSMVFAEVYDGFGSNDLGAGKSAPPGFIDELFRDCDEESLEPVMVDLYERLRRSVERVSALGNFQQPLRALVKLVGYPNCAKALVNHPRWIPRDIFMLIGEGRAVETSSILGAFFHVSALSDYKDFRSKPDVGQQCFSESSTRRPADLSSSFTTIRTVMNILYDGLAEVFRTLLKSVDTREKVLEYLAVVIKKNAARSRIQVDPMSCASSGMFVNLSAVMLRLCEPFLDASSSKRDKIDPNYIFYNNRLDLRHLTSLCASSEEVSAWINKNTHEDALKSEDRNDGDNRALQSQQATSSGNNSGISTFSKAKSLMSCKSMVKYSFICECFFMTSRVLNLGLMKALSDYKHLAQELARFEEDLSSYQAMRDQGASPQLETDIKHLEREIEILLQEKLCYEAQILRSP